MSPYSISTLSSAPLMPLLCGEGVQGEVLDSVEKSLCIALTLSLPTLNLHNTYLYVSAYLISPTDVSHMQLVQPYCGGL